MSDCGSTRTLSSNGDNEYDTHLHNSSADTFTLIEGPIKFREGKKWKQRFSRLTKLSPVADCLQLQIYRDEKEKARNGHTKASLSLQNFLAMETGFTLDKESQTLALICADVVVILGFDSRERLLQWSVRLSNNLGECSSFLVQLISVPPKSKLSIGPVRLHVREERLCLTGGLPPKLVGLWEISNLRRYGAVDGKIVIEGGSRCEKGEGIHVLLPHPQQINQIITSIESTTKHNKTNSIDSPRKGNLFRKLSEIKPSYDTFDEFGAWKSECGSDDGVLDSVSLIHSHCPSPTQATQLGVNSGHPHQIGQAFPSSLERCISCMSKLGQSSIPADLLKPSWTMDLGVDNQHDRISLSSHGSSSNGCENYDTPRGAILRRSATPNGHPHSHAQKSFTGPYENYDVPKSQCQCPHQLTHQIDWNKKLAMDRSSVASSGFNPDWYDTPKKSCDCAIELAQVQVHHHHNAQIQNALENYDVPPSQPMGVGASVNGQGRMPLVAQAIYAQVDKTKKTPKQPLYANSLQQAQPMYANSPQQYSHNCAHFEPTHSHCNVKCQQPLYMNSLPQTQHPVPCSHFIQNQPKCHQLTPSQPLYENSNSNSVQVQLKVNQQSTNLCQDQKHASSPSFVQRSPNRECVYQNTDPAPTNRVVESHTSQNANYVNLNFASSLELYENSKADAQVSNGNAAQVKLRASPVADNKNGRENRASLSSESDSGVSGDGPIESDETKETTPTNEMQQLRITVDSNETVQNEIDSKLTEANYSEIEEKNTSPRHYETISDTKNSILKSNGVLFCTESTSSGTSDMSDYIDNLNNSKIFQSNPNSLIGGKNNLKPRSGKEYTKIDRSKFN